MPKFNRYRRKNVQSDQHNIQFKSRFEAQVSNTIKRFRLFTKKDRIAVAVSGGKDSTVCLYVLKKLGYKVEGITVDSVIGSYTRKNLKRLRQFCKAQNIRLTELSFRDEFGGSLCYLKSVLKSKCHSYASCMLCGILRRYLLNKYARKLRFDYLATGHNIDDEAQSIVMNICRNDHSRLVRLGPETGVIRSRAFVQRIKPLYLCTEKEITEYSKMMGFDVVYTRCPCSVDAFRKKFRDELDRLEKKDPDVKRNIVDFYLENIYPMKKSIMPGRVKSCNLCQEPSSQDVCKKCEIIISLQER